jgi:hypothetical protein
VESGSKISDEPLKYVSFGNNQGFFCFGEPSSHSDRSGKVKMSGKTKSGLRQIATIVTAGLTLVALAAVLIINVQAEAPKYIRTAEFLKSKLVEEKYLEGFTPGVPEYGFSLEAISQLTFATGIDIAAAKEFLLETDISYLKSEATGLLQPGLAGKFLYASKVSIASNDDAVDEVKQQLLAMISESGQITVAGASTFDYAWLTLGFWAQGERDTASKLADQLSTLARSDGGFGFDQSEFTTESTTDATAMAIQALVLTVNQDANTQSSKTQSIDSALAFLDSSIKEGNHFVAYEAEDVNGTALALMAYKAATGQAPDAMKEWLARKIQSDGGLGSPWVEGAGDAYATAQGYLALEGKSYLDLLGG